jgi:type IV pilus secretin PilQ/predicted competence protein
MTATGMASEDPAITTNRSEGKGFQQEEPVVDGYGADEIRFITNVRSARVRESPSFDAPVEYGLVEGDSVVVRKRQGDWYFIVRDDGKKGWGYKSIFVSTDHFTQSHETDRDTGGLINRDMVGIEGYEQDGYEIDKTETVENRSESSNERGEKAQTGSQKGFNIEWIEKDRLSINFLDVDIREALTAIALEKQINITSSKEVTGNITVHLYNQTLDKALDAITMAGGFSYTKQGDLYFVFKPKKDKDPQQERLQMRIFKLRYASVDKVQDILSSVAGTRMIKIHEPTKTIIVEETPENMAKVEDIINQWDRKPEQVLIEAKILEVTLTDEMSFGVNWSKILGDVRLGTGSFSRALLPSSNPVTPVPSTGSGIFGNIITAAGTSRQFSAAIDALQARTRINILSTPKILAVHGKPAKVQVGGQQGYSVTTTNEGVSTETIEFIDTGTILDITPYIDGDNILLDVKPSIRSARIEEGIPVVNATEVSTWLTARDGETLFIGGLIQDTKTKTRETVPCLGGIPGVGGVFGSTTREIGKTELVILITPNIIKNGDKQAESELIEKTEKEERAFKETNNSMDF